jgi:hypothetical protein
MQNYLGEPVLLIKFAVADVPTISCVLALLASLQWTAFLIC